MKGLECELLIKHKWINIDKVPYDPGVVAPIIKSVSLSFHPLQEKIGERNSNMKQEAFENTLQLYNIVHTI